MPMLNKNKFILIGILLVILFFGAVYKVGNEASAPEEIFLNYRTQVQGVEDFFQLEQLNKKYFSKNLMEKTKQKFNFSRLSKQEADRIIKGVKDTLFVSGNIKNRKQSFDDKKTAELIVTFNSGKTYQVPFVFENNSWKFATFEEYSKAEK